MPLEGPRLERPFDIRHLLSSGLAEKPHDLALVSAITRRTWQEVEAEVLRLAAGYLSFGLKPGDRIASLMPNRADLLVHYLACFKAGLVATPLNYRYRAPEIDHALSVSQASAILAHRERQQDLDASAQVAQLPLGVIHYGEAGDGKQLFETLAQTPALATLPDADADSPAMIFFTSGSTGKPKGVTHSFSSLGWMMASAAGAFEMTPDDVVLPASSISHLGGFLFGFSALGSAARLVVARNLDGDYVLPLIRSTRPSVLCMLPAALFALIRDHGARREDFASLRVCRGGGDKVALELEHEFTALTGKQIDEGYGMSEVGLACLNPPSGVIKDGSVGVPIPGFRVSIRDEAGRELPTGEEGRLWMKTCSATTGYWERPDATEALFDDGWLDSGDIMRADQDGYLWFCGRKKQIIVHDGSNICPQEVEGALLEHHSLATAGVVGVHDLLHGEDVVAYVTLRPDAAQPSSQELIRFARERVGYKAPEEIVFLEEMPLNATGKVDRVTLKQWAADRHGTEPG